MFQYFFIAAVIFFSSSMAQTTESYFEENHDADHCLHDLHALLEGPGAFRWAYSMLAKPNSNSIGCQNQDEFTGKNAEKIKSIFYSNKGITLRQIKRLFESAKARLSSLRDDKKANRINQDQLCQTIRNDEAITVARYLEENVGWAFDNCSYLQQLGLGCGDTITKSSYAATVHAFDSKLDDLLLRAKEERLISADMPLFGFLSDRFSTLYIDGLIRVPDLQPLRRTALKSDFSPDGKTINIRMFFTRADDFPADSNWEKFSAEFKRTIESFWQGKGFRFELVEVTRNTAIDPSNVWKIGYDKATHAQNSKGYAFVDGDRMRISFLPEVIAGNIPVWRHEFGHVIGFGEAYGNWIDASGGACQVGFFNDRRNVMNNMALDGDGSKQKLNQRQVNGIVEAYHPVSNPNANDQFILKRLDGLPKKAAEIMQILQPRK